MAYVKRTITVSQRILTKQLKQTKLLSKQRDLDQILHGQLQVHVIETTTLEVFRTTMKN